MPDSPSVTRELLHALQRLGFTDYEARAYAALTRRYPATAYEIAKATGLPRANVYGVFQALESRGAIQPVTENPTRYAPLDPESFFGQIQKSTSELCRGVAEKIRRQSKVDDELYMWVFRGEAEVRGKLVQLIDGARHHVWIRASAAFLDPLQPQIDRAAKRGVDVKLIVYGTNLKRFATHRGIAVFPHEGDGSSTGTAADVLLSMTTDFDNAMIVSYAEQVTGSCTRNHSIVYVVQNLLLHEVYLAEIYAAIGPLMLQKFGKRLEKLRRKHRPPEMGRVLLDKN